MTTQLYFHPICIEHDPGEMHPECPGRLRSVMTALSSPDFNDLVRLEAPQATVEQLNRAHDADYVRLVLDNVPNEGRVHLDPDTAMCPESGEAALRGAGAACAAVDAVLAGETDNAFCAVRPPGHHAERDRAMGFCLFNNVAVAAEHARSVHGLKRVAVVDFDVHHGNGTQHTFYDDPDVFFGSSHQSPFYPGTGNRDETGAGDATCNVPLPAGAGSVEFKAAWADTILPAMERFRPELIIISAGFDAHERDPLAELNVKTEDYRWITAEIAGVAARVCSGRMISSLEGGYDLQALGESVDRHVRALMAA